MGTQIHSFFGNNITFPPKYRVSIHVKSMSECGMKKQILEETLEAQLS